MKASFTMTQKTDSSIGPGYGFALLWWHVIHSCSLQPDGIPVDLLLKPDQGVQPGAGVAPCLLPGSGRHGRPGRAAQPPGLQAGLPHQWAGGGPQWPGGHTPDTRRHAGESTWPTETPCGVVITTHLPHWFHNVENIYHNRINYPCINVQWYPTWDFIYLLFYNITFEFGNS